MNQCKHNLLGYGSAKLQTLSDVQLEALDPYQRDANELSKCLYLRGRMIDFRVRTSAVRSRDVLDVSSKSRCRSNRSFLPQSGHRLWGTIRAEPAW